MRALVLSLTVTCLFLSCISMAQPAGKALVRFESAAFSMGVNNHEQILVGTRVGEVAFTDSVKGFWRKGNVNSGSGSSLSGELIDNVCYFNADIALQDEVLEIKNIYYEPTAFYFPWRITLNGTTSTTMSIEINRFLNSVFPNFLDCNKRVEVIQGIV